MQYVHILVYNTVQTYEHILTAPIPKSRFWYNGVGGGVHRGRGLLKVKIHKVSVLSPRIKRLANKAPDAICTEESKEWGKGRW